MCGCHASDHSVCEDWARERDASRARVLRAQHERQRQRSQRVLEHQNDRNAHIEHYKTLGVAANASRQEIHKAYRRAALLWHPDKHSHKAESERNSATKMFIRVSEAFKAIGDLS
jgi:DnaJ-class molecular chaperone